MPRLSDSMEEGTVQRWLKASGDTVRRGDDLLEIETDNGTMTFQADADGLLEIIAQPGETLPIGAAIGSLLPAGPASAKTEEPTNRAATAAMPAGGRIRASPIARRIAREQGLDLARVTGSGPGGRIIRADIEGQQPNRQPDTPGNSAFGASVQAPPDGSVAAAQASPTAKGLVTVETPTRAQQVIARRMSSSKATVPEFTLSAVIDMDRCVDLRTRLAAMRPDDPVASYDDLVVKACGLALREHPRANAAWRDGRFEYYSRVNIGIAVAGQGALLVPTVFDADKLPLEQITTETRRLAGRVRDRKITPPELAGATFTVSNLGMFGVRRFTAVIIPPQAAILAVGAVTDRPMVRGGHVVAGRAMDVTLSCDHRILYGADAAGFLASVCELLEEPLALLR